MLSTMYWTTAEIKQRGWTDKMIKDYLGKPCKEGLLNISTNKRNVKAWHIDRVTGMESTPEVVAMIDKNLKSKIIDGKITVGQSSVFKGACARYLQRMKLPVPKTQEAMEEIRITLSNM